MLIIFKNYREKFGLQKWDIKLLGNIYLLLTRNFGDFDFVRSREIFELRGIRFRESQL